MAAHKLPTLAKFFIVKALACNYTPTEVVMLVRQCFGITISRQTVEYYDPRKSSQIKEQWRTYFLQQFKTYHETLDNLPMESRAYRQKLRMELLERATERGNYDLALRILDSAGTEASGGFIAKTSRSKRKKWKP